MITVVTVTDESSRARYAVFEGNNPVGEGWIGVWKNSHRSGRPGIRGYNTAHAAALAEAKKFMHGRYGKRVPFKLIRRGRDWMNLS